MLEEAAGVCSRDGLANSSVHSGEALSSRASSCDATRALRPLMEDQSHSCIPSLGSRVEIAAGMRTFRESVTHFLWISGISLTGEILLTPAPVSSNLRPDPTHTASSCNYWPSLCQIFRSSRLDHLDKASLSERKTRHYCSFDSRLRH